MMKICLLSLVLLPALLCHEVMDTRAQEFQFHQELDSIPVVIDGWQPFCPWGGGSETAPDFCDIDSDGDWDLFVGNYGGRISFFENIGNAQVAQFELITFEYAGVDLSGNLFAGRTAPEFCDLDGDGDYDLFTSDFRGLVHYWENQGSVQMPNFVFVTDSLDSIQTPGASRLDFCDIDADGDYDLFMGTGMAGWIYFYRNDGTPQNANFVLVSTQWQSINVGSYASPEFCDIDADADFDLFVGREHNSANATNGDVFFYKNIGTPTSPAFQLITPNYLTLDVGQNAIEQLIDIDADGKLDLFVGSGDNIRYYQNNGTSQNPSFTLVTTQFQGIYLNDMQPFFCDLDADGDYDLVAGTSAWPPSAPALHFYVNRGTPQNPRLVFYTDSIALNNYYVIITPSLADIDADGDLDLFVFDDQGDFYFYQNNGTASRPRFQFVTQNWQGINVANHRYARFFDIDSDGDLDLFFDCYPFGNQVLGNLCYYENIGTPQQAQMILRTNQYLPTGASVATAWFCDIDNDSLTDLFVGEHWGGVLYFHGTDTQVASSKVQTFISLMTGQYFTIGPNPANPITVVSCQFLVPSNISLQVFDISGRMLAELASGFHLPGEYRYVWDATPNASGVYLIRLQTPGAVRSEKVVVVK